MDTSTLDAPAAQAPKAQPRILYRNDPWPKEWEGVQFYDVHARRMYFRTPGGKSVLMAYMEDTTRSSVQWPDDSYARGPGLDAAPWE